MSGTRRITAQTLELLADNPIHGPTHDQRVVSAPAVTGIKHIASQAVYTLPTVPVAPSSTVQVTTGGSVTAMTPLYTLLPNSGQVAVSNPVVAPPVVTLPGLQYGVVEVDWHLVIASSAAIAPTFGATRTVAEYVFTVQFLDNLGTPFQEYSYEGTVRCFGGAAQSDLFTMTFFVPYVATRTFGAISAQITNNCTGLDNTITVQSFSVATIRVVQ